MTISRQGDPSGVSPGELQLATDDRLHPLRPGVPVPLRRHLEGVHRSGVDPVKPALRGVGWRGVPGPTGMPRLYMRAPHRQSAREWGNALSFTRRYCDAWVRRARTAGLLAHRRARIRPHCSDKVAGPMTLDRCLSLLHLRTEFSRFFCAHSWSVATINPQMRRTRLGDHGCGVTENSPGRAVTGMEPRLGHSGWCVMGIETLYSAAHAAGFAMAAPEEAYEDLEAQAMVRTPNASPELQWQPSRGVLVRETPGRSQRLDRHAAGATRPAPAGTASCVDGGGLRQAEL